MTTKLESRSDSAEKATIHNISETGLLIEVPFSLDVGEVLQIDLPAAGTQVARVVWADNELHGCKFDNPIPPAALNAERLAAPFDRPKRDDDTEQLQTERRSKLPLHTRFLTIVGLALLSWGLVAVVLAFFSRLSSSP